MNTLPFDCIGKIFEFSDMTDYKNISKVNKDFRHIYSYGEFQAYIRINDTSSINLIRSYRNTVKIIIDMTDIKVNRFTSLLEQLSILDYKNIDTKMIDIWKTRNNKCGINIKRETINIIKNIDNIIIYGYITFDSIIDVLISNRHIYLHKNVNIILTDHNFNNYGSNNIEYILNKIVKLTTRTIKLFISCICEHALKCKIHNKIITKLCGDIEVSKAYNLEELYSECTYEELF